MKVAKNITELIGNTPLVQLNKVVDGGGEGVVQVRAYLLPLSGT